MSLDAWRTWWVTHGERELRCILMTAWDPIGVGFEPRAWDEYDDYAGQIARRLQEAADVAQAIASVSAYLTQTQGEQMGLQEDARRATHNRWLAESLWAWYQWSFVHAGRAPGEWLPDD